MAKEKLVTIHVHTPFTLTLGDQSKQEFGRGRHNVPEEVASHWFTQAHSELSDSVVSGTDDLQPIIDSLQAQIAAAQTGGDGAKDAKESKSTNGK
ncbi:TPA: STY1053 family phage-associated protein [Citrobacter freundii]